MVGPQEGIVGRKQPELRDEAEVAPNLAVRPSAVSPMPGLSDAINAGEVLEQPPAGRAGLGVARLGRVSGSSARGRVIRGLERVLSWSGAAGAFAAVTRATGAVILTYHSVTMAAEAGWIEPTYSTRPEVFERHVRFLARSRRVIPLAELLDELERGREPRRGAVCITFDDAYRNTLREAAPILAEHGLPATLFVPTGMVDRGEAPWLDTLFGLFVHRTVDAVDLPELGVVDASLDQPGRATRALRRLNRAFIGLDLAARTNAISRLREQFEPIGTPPRLVMDWDEVDDLQSRFPGFSIGAHSVDHVDLTGVSEDEARRQVVGSRDAIAQNLGAPPTVFSCPYDRTSPTVARLIREAGFRAGLSAGADVLVTPRTDRFGLARVTAPESVGLVRFVTSGAHPRLPRLLFGRSQ